MALFDNKNDIYMTHNEQTKGQQKITDKVLSLLEYLDKETPESDELLTEMPISFVIEIRKRLDEISLEAFAEIELNKCEHRRLRSALGDDFATCLDCGKEINEPLK